MSVLRSSASGFVPAAAGNDGLDHSQQISAPMREFAHEEPLVLFNLLAFGDVIGAVDCARDFSVLILERTDIDDGGDPRSVGPLDDYFLVIDLRQFSRDHLRHGALVVGHETAVRSEHLHRAAETFAVVAACRSAAPQFRSTLVEVPNDAAGIAGIDGRGPQFE